MQLQTALSSLYKLSIPREEKSTGGRRERGLPRQTLSFVGKILFNFVILNPFFPSPSFEIQTHSAGGKATSFGFFDKSSRCLE
jgi:hypothetical protein